MCSVTEQGQGTEGIFAQIAASAVGVTMDKVRVITGDTGVTPYGGGTWASRGAGIGGEAVLQSGRALRANILEVAAAILNMEQGGRSTSSDNAVVNKLTQRIEAAAGGARPHRLLPPRHAAAGFPVGADGHAPLHAARVRLHVHQRHPGLARRSRRRHRLRQAAQALVRRGLRHGDQPDAGRRADARRRRAGHRRGAVRGVPLQPRRPAAQRQHGRLPGADGGRDARHHLRARRDADRSSRSSAPRARARPAPPARRAR